MTAPPAPPSPDDDSPASDLATVERDHARGRLLDAAAALIAQADRMAQRGNIDVGHLRQDAARFGHDVAALVDAIDGIGGSADKVAVVYQLLLRTLTSRSVASSLRDGVAAERDRRRDEAPIPAQVDRMIERQAENRRIVATYLLPRLEADHGLLDQSIHHIALVLLADRDFERAWLDLNTPKGFGRTRVSDTKAIRRHIAEIMRKSDV